MAEHKACADVVSLTSTGSTVMANDEGINGELKPNLCSLSVKPANAIVAATVDDSGTESGEEVNQKMLVQVQGALANLESALPALDPLRRSSVVELLTKLQTSLRLSSSSLAPSTCGNGGADAADTKPTPPPRRYGCNKKDRQDRHTVGVSSEELQDARRWLEENGYAVSAAPAPAIIKPVLQVTPRSYETATAAAQPAAFRPVKFVPPPPKRAPRYVEDYIPEPSKQSLHNGSFSCPPVQHVVVESLRDRGGGGGKIMAITRDRGHSSELSSSCDPSDENNNDDDDDDDDDYDDEDEEHRRSVSSAQRLLQIASSDRKFRHGKRAKLKRTGPDVSAEHSSGDERSPSLQHGGGGVPVIVVAQPQLVGGVPPFEPKTASDKKYLALLQQAREEEKAAEPPSAYNPLHGKLQGNWGNRFGRIRTTFESKSGATSATSSPKGNMAKHFWHDICKCPSDDSIAYRTPKRATSFKPVAAWSGENGFSHGSRSAFKPVAQKIATPQPVAKPVGKPVARSPPRRLPLYNSAVTTAHRPFVYAADDVKQQQQQQQWSALSRSPCSASDWTSPSNSPCPTDFEESCGSVVSRVMGSPQTASIVKSNMRGGRSLQPSASAQSVPSVFAQPSNNRRGSPQHCQPLHQQRAIPHDRPQQQPVSCNKQSAPLLQQVPRSRSQQQQQPSSRAPLHQAPRPPPRSSPPHVFTQQRSPTTSPVRMPSVLQKSESWHQMIMDQTKAAARPSQPSRSRATPYEAHVHSKREIAQKQVMVRQHLRAPEPYPPSAVLAGGGGVGGGGGGGGCTSGGSSRRASPRSVVKLNDDIDKVEDTFESLFNEACSKAK